MRRFALLSLLSLAACGTALSWNGAWEEDPEPSGPPELRIYKEAHYRALGRQWTESVTLDELREELASKRVLLLGDRHEDLALHAAQTALLEDLVQGDRKLILGIEALGTQDQPDIDAYLAGRIDMDVLRQRVRERWPGSWLDRTDLDGGFYRDLLRFGRQHGVAVQALEPVPRQPLDMRDATLARHIRKLAFANPRALIVAVIGHAHLLGEGHVVAQLELPATVIGALPNVSLLKARAARKPRPSDARFERTDTGVLLFTGLGLGLGLGSEGRPI